MRELDSSRSMNATRSEYGALTRNRFRQTPVFESLVDELMDSVRSEPGSFPKKAVGGAQSTPLWSLDSPRVSDRLEAVPHSAYESDAFAPDPEIAPIELATDAESVFTELGLKPGLTADQIAVIRRSFARRNHPDRFPPDLRKIATERMMIANALCDGYPLKKT